MIASRPRDLLLTISDDKNLGVSPKLVSPSRSLITCSSKQESRQDSWEVVEGLSKEVNYTQEPPVQKVFLLKKRKAGTIDSSI